MAQPSQAVVLDGHTKDLGGGFRVSRLLPAAQRRSIGPFVFFDHFGPIRVGAGDNHDVRPHPHIGLATVTYLFSGAMMHRDSLGTVQRIEPGAINWMSAGEGIVHSERAPDDLRGSSYVNHGLQLWVALPQAMEASPPSFTHTPAAAIGGCELPGASIKVLIGEALGLRSPVPAASPTLLLDVGLAAGARVALPLQAEELGVYAVDEAISVQGQPVAARQLLALGSDDEPLIIEASSSARVMIIGGQSLGPRFMWWNFVASSKAAIEAAALRWEQAGFRPVPGETEHIPLPAAGRPA